MTAVQIAAISQFELSFHSAIMLRRPGMDLPAERSVRNSGDHPRLTHEASSGEVTALDPVACARRRTSATRRKNLLGTIPFANHSSGGDSRSRVASGHRRRYGTAACRSCKGEVQSVPVGRLLPKAANPFRATPSTLGRLLHTERDRPLHRAPVEALRRA